LPKLFHADSLATIAVFMEEPKGKTAETLPDGTIQMIDVA
jgi:hypothetical protein